MNLLLDDTTASFQVFPYWQRPTNRTENVAKLEIITKDEATSNGLDNTLSGESTHTRKRGRHRSFPSGTSHNNFNSSDFFRLTLWQASKNPADTQAGRPALTRKSFTRVYEILEPLPGSHSPGAKVLAVATVVDEAVQLTATYVAVVLPTRRGTSDNIHSIQLVQVGETECKLTDYGEIAFIPKSVVIMRGPTLLVRSTKEVHVLRSPELSLDHTPPPADLSDASKCYAIALSDRDSQTVLVESARNILDGTAQVSFAQLSSNGNLGRFSILRDCAEAKIRGAYVSFSCFLLLLVSDRNVIALDFRSHQQLWRVPIRGKHGAPRSTVIYRGDIFLLFASSSQIWRIITDTSQCDSSPKRLLTPLFSDKFSVVTTGNGKGYFYAPWRNHILQLNDQTGMCFRDEEAEQEWKTSSDSRASGVTPSLELATEYLQQRVEEGIQQFINVTDRLGEKSRMRDYISTLTADLARGPLMAPGAGSFGTDLRPLAFKSSESHPSVNTRSNIESKLSTGPTKVLMNGQATVSLLRSQLVRLLETSCHLDATQQLIIFTMKVTVLQQDPPEEPERDDEYPLEDSAALHLSLNLRFDKPISATWTLQSNAKAHAGEIVSLSASTVLGNVASSLYTLNDMRVLARIDCADGRSQLLGSYSLSTILSPGLQGPECGTSSAPFVKSFCIAAIGPGAQVLRCSPTISRLLEDDVVRVEVQDDVAIIQVRASSGVDLALTTARLRMCAVGKVRFLPLMEPSRKSVGPLEDALSELEKDVDLFWDIACDKGTTIISPFNIQRVLTQQMALDEAYGHIVELKLSLDDGSEATDLDD